MVLISYEFKRKKAKKTTSKLAVLYKLFTKTTTNRLQDKLHAVQYENKPISGVETFKQ